MISAAGDATLKKGLTTHLAQTEEHAARLETIFESMGAKPEAKKCDAMEGLVMSGEHVIEIRWPAPKQEIPASSCHR